MSQFSDAYTSSLYDADITDSGLVLPSDEITPGLSISQQSFPYGAESVVDSDFIRPTLPSNPVPTSLECVRPDRINRYVVYSSMTSNDYVNWWLQTDFGKKRRLRWDSRHSSEVWNHFSQVAKAQDGTPKVMCKQCKGILDHPGLGNGTSTMKKHVNSCNKRSKNHHIQDFMREAPKPQPVTVFSQQDWETSLLRFITESRLPFQLLEHPGFHNLISMAQRAPQQLEIPSAKTARRWLQSTIFERHQQVLDKLPKDGKISIALDCWTSPFQQAFMAVTGYFIDDDWNYREMLLGFEPLHGSHSGSNLGSVLLQLLQRYNLTHRVLAITTDNASNNNTLMASIQETIQSLDLHNNTAIIRVPCIAHVIQLSLKQLLGQMKANPKNDATEEQWTESQDQLVRSRHHKREIIDTLNKLRSLAVFINASPQRREAFCKLQPNSPAVIPIQDVRTRWNSTFLMLQRAKRLQAFLDEFCCKYGHPYLKLDQEQWRQIDYLLWITQPFHQFTTALSKTTDVTVHLIFAIYNKLFDHLEKSITQLARKNVPWKKIMLTALHAARTKLSQYYSKTDQIEGDLFAISTMLAPQHKLQFFRSKDWGPEWLTRYQQSFTDYFEPYRQSYSKRQHGEGTQRSSIQTTDIDLFQMVGLDPSGQESKDDELTKYLESPTMSGMPVRIFWKEHQHTFPALAKLARDVLSIPATGAGVERLFNSARDICHYRRGSLNATTIQELMLYKCTTKFELEEETIALRKEYLSTEEIETNQEEKYTHLADSIEPISDDEENREEEDVTETTLDQHVTPVLSERAMGKRRRSNASELDENQESSIPQGEDDDLPLPEIQQRISGRIRKRPRYDNDQFVSY